jgi:hypothetical protein
VREYSDLCINGLCNIMWSASMMKAVHRLKSDERDGDSLLTTGHFIFAPQELYVHLALLISSMISHGLITNDLRSSSIISIPKSKGISVNRPNIEVLLSAPQ